MPQERGGTFIKAIENEPATLDYLFGKDFGALTVATNLYNRLFWLDLRFQLESRAGGELRDLAARPDLHHSIEEGRQVA